MEITALQFMIICPLVFLAGFVDAVAGGGGLISLPAYMIAGLPVHMANHIPRCRSAAIFQKNMRCQGAASFLKRVKGRKYEAPKCSDFLKSVRGRKYEAPKCGNFLKV